MALGDSTITYMNKPAVNPFRSRSTLICISCLVTLVIIDGLAMASGYFDATFACASLMVLREMIDKSLNHQAKTDPIKNEKAPPASPSAS